MRAFPPPSFPHSSRDHESPGPHMDPSYPSCQQHLGFSSVLLLILRNRVGKFSRCVQVSITQCLGREQRRVKGITSQQ